MNKTIATLRQSFTEPSADLMQQHPLCGICWTDYDGEDRPVKLPCGHVFGEVVSLLGRAVRHPQDVTAAAHSAVLSCFHRVGIFVVVY